MESLSISSKLVVPALVYRHLPSLKNLTSCGIRFSVCSAFHYTGKRDARAHQLRLSLIGTSARRNAHITARPSLALNQASAEQYRELRWLQDVIRALSRDFLTSSARELLFREHIVAPSFFAVKP